MDNQQPNQPFSGSQDGQPPPRQIQVKANDEVLKGFYSTHMQVAHSREEFILDFMNLFPPQATLVSRIIVSPAHLKRMVNALNDNLKRYEDRYGRIKEVEGIKDKEFGFKVN